MSKDSYARGFVKAAAAAGVDPTELAKFVRTRVIPALKPEITDSDKGAGIGSLLDNLGVPEWLSKDPKNFYLPAPPHKGSYFEAIRRNHPDNISVDEFQEGMWKYIPKHMGYGQGPISEPDLRAIRSRQARDLAQEVFPDGSEPMRALQKSLRRAGEQNYRKYTETGIVPKRDAPDRTGIEKIKIPKSVLDYSAPNKSEDDYIKMLQDMMVRNQANRKQNLA